MLPEQVYTNLDDGVFYGESDGCYYYDSDGDGLPDTMLLDPAIINSNDPNSNDPDDDDDDDDDNDYGDEPPTGGGLTDEELMNLGRQAIGKMQTDISNGTFTYIFP